MMLSDHPGPPPQRRPEIRRDDAPSCDCERTVLARRRRSNGVEVVVRQCCRCGSEKGAVKKSECPDLAAVAPWRQMIADAWRKKVDDYYAERRAELAQETSQEWWDWYKRYLKSAAWMKRRLKALERDSGLCQGCRIRRATQVHHLTYDRVGYEMLFDLISLCDECHDQVHNKRQG